MTVRVQNEIFFFYLLLFSTQYSPSSIQIWDDAELRRLEFPVWHIKTYEHTKGRETEWGNS